MSASKRQAGPRWLRSVMDRHEGPLLRYAAHLLGDAERARDVVQDTFLKLCESSRGESDDHLSQWLFTVCRNRAIDVLRKERRMSLLDADIQAAQPSKDPSPPAVAQRKEVAELVSDAVAALPGRQQEVIRLKFQNGFSYKQIAAITGLSVSNVGFAIHAAVKQLRDSLQARGLIGPAGGE